MVPTDIKLLDLVRRTTRQVSAGVTDEHLKSLLDGVDIALNELISRQKTDFYIDHIAQGRRLARQGLDLIDQGPEAAAAVAAVANLNGDDPTDADRFDRLGERIDDVARALKAVISALRGRKDGTAVAYQASIIEWEIKRLAHREQNAEGFDERETLPPEITGEGLIGYLHKRFPEWRDLELVSFRALVGGFSKKTLLFETKDAVNGMQKLVARVAPLHNFLNFDAYELPREHGLLSYLFKAGLPIAEPVLLEPSREPLGAPFLISRMATGRNMGTVQAVAEPLSDEMVAEIARVLVSLHKQPLDPNDPDLARSHIPRWLTRGMRENTAMTVQDWWDETQRSRLDPSPTIERALSWLADNVPDFDDPPSMLHADFGVHNFLVEDGRITAVLDWEVSRAGDPADDITYFMLGAGKLVSYETLMEAYVAAGGKPISTYRLRYFDVYQSVKILMSGYAAFSQIERWDSVGISHALFALRFVTQSTRRINSLIAAAEAAR